MNLAYQYAIPRFTVGLRLWAEFENKDKTKACFKVCKVLKITETKYYVILLKNKVNKWMLKVDAYPYLDAPHPPTDEEVDFRRDRNWNATRPLDREALEAYRKEKDEVPCLKL